MRCPILALVARISVPALRGGNCGQNCVHRLASVLIAQVARPSDALAADRWKVGLSFVMAAVDRHAARDFAQQFGRCFAPHQVRRGSLCAVRVLALMRGVRVLAAVRVRGWQLFAVSLCRRNL